MALHSNAERFKTDSATGGCLNVLSAVLTVLSTVVLSYLLHNLPFVHSSSTASLPQAYNMCSTLTHKAP